MPRAARASGGAVSQPSLWGTSGSGAPPRRTKANTPQVETAYQSQPPTRLLDEATARPIAPYETAYRSQPPTRLLDEATASGGPGRARGGSYGTPQTAVPGGRPGRFGAGLTGPPLDPNLIPGPGTAAFGTATELAESQRAPGSFTLDPTSPAGLANSLKRDKEEADNLVGGLNSLLFGKGTIIGDIPVVGDIARAVTAPLAGVSNVVSGVAERVPSLASVAGLGGIEVERQRVAFENAPPSLSKTEVEEAIAADPTRANYLREQFLRAQTQAEQFVSPILYPELQWGSTSLAGDLGFLLTGMGIFSRPIERITAGAGKSTGMNRLQEIWAVMDGGSYTGVGGTGLAGGSAGLSEIELLAGTKTRDGTWTPDQALDFLSAAGAGFSHDQALNILGEVALDPTFFGSIGASSLSKLGVTGMKLARTNLPIRAGKGPARPFNVVGKVAETEAANRLVRAFGVHVYDKLGASAAGRTAKIARTIVDPLHAIGGTKPSDRAILDVATELGPRVMDDAYGFGNAMRFERNMKGISDDLYEAHLEDKAIFTANMTRKVVIEQGVANILVQGFGHLLEGITPGTLIDDLMKKVPREYKDVLKERIAAARKTDWDEAGIQNLGERMAILYGHKSPVEWADHFRAELAGDGGREYLGLAHAATYGRAQKNLLTAVQESTDLVGAEAAEQMKLPRMIVVNRETLTDLGGEGILRNFEALRESGSYIEDAAKYLKQVQGQYPSLRYVVFDPANPVRSIDKFIKRLQANLDEGLFPHQLTDAEIKGLPQPLADFDKVSHDIFTLAVRPSDDLLFGLADDGEGLYVQAFEPWVDHVATGSPGYRGASAVRYNAAGMPILGETVGKTIDYIEQARRTLASRVSSRLVTNEAKKRWTTKGRLLGLSPEETDDIFGAVIERAQLFKTTVRGLEADDIWKAAEPLIPQRLRQTSAMMPRDLMVAMIEAWEGDMRFVGLTQKFTGRAKSVWAGTTGNNYAGQMSEELYPKIKFRMALQFQAQERIEPFILNGQRGANPALGTKFSEADRISADMERRLALTSPNRAANFDMAEMAAQGLIGKRMSDVLGRLVPPSKWEQARDVLGAKRVNSMRTFAHTLGKETRAIWDELEPGTWQRMVDQESIDAGKHITDDEMALRYYVRQSMANDVRIDPLIAPGTDYADWRREIMEWAQPAHIGEVRPLGLDKMAQAMGFTHGRTGKVTSSVGELRAALADPTSGITDEVVEDALSVVGASSDYRRRVKNALNFHWDDFWNQVAAKYNAVPAEVARQKTLVKNAARARNMSPVEYISQFWAPSIYGGSEASVEAIGDAITLLRAPAKGATIENFVEQAAHVFHSHLDPSMQDTLLRDFEKALPEQINTAMVSGTPEGATASRALQGTLEQLRGGWTRDTSRKFARRILDYIEGKPPTERFDEIVDPAQGVDEVRTAAAEYMRAQGLEPPVVRRYFPVDPEFGRRTAVAYDELPEVPYESTGPVTPAKLEKASTKLKPTPEGIDATTVKAYEAFVRETRKQYLAIRAKGIRFEPVAGDPYPNSAAMVEDVRVNKRLKVYMSEAAHPLMTDAQNVMFRGVHDYFAHAAEGFQFGARGELNAAVKHAQMYSAEARRAMLTETHGQNSVVNFSDRLAYPAPATPPAAAVPEPAVAPAAPTAAAAPAPTPRVPTQAVRQPKYDLPRVLGDLKKLRSQKAASEYAQKLLADWRRGDVIDDLPDGVFTSVSRIADLTDPRELDDLISVYGTKKAALEASLGDLAEASAADARNVLATDNVYTELMKGRAGRPVRFKRPDTDVTFTLTSGEGAIFKSLDVEGFLFRRSGSEIVGTEREFTKSYPLGDAKNFEVEVRAAIDDALNTIEAPAVAPTVPVAPRATPRADAFRVAHSTAEDLVSKRPNAAMGEKALDKLREVDEDNIVDLGAAEGALEDYRSIDRADYPGDPESYADARAEAWEAFQEEVRAILDDEVGLEQLDELADEPIVLDTSRGFADDIEDVTPDYEPTGAKIEGLTGEPNSMSFEQYGGSSEVIWYGPDGKAHGYATHFGGNKLDRRAGISVYVEPSYRRQGVATKMYDELEARGVDISAVTGKTVTAAGRAFTQSRSARKAAALLPPPDLRTVAQVNKEKPGTIYATQKAGLLPQDILDEFGQRFIGVGKGLESNPDVIRATQQFAKWSKEVLAEGLLGADRQWEDLLTRVTGIPTDAAVPYNHMQQLAIGLQGDAITRASEDAFRLTYFKRTRTVLERSINHPFLGIYPASYMFGKILPEIVNFIAREPFGVRTGAAAYLAADVRKSLAVQMEYDPNFEIELDKMGHSAALWMLGYMIPTVPWEIGAAAPAWLRNLAEQALANQRRVDRGEEPKPIDLQLPMQKIIDAVNPFRSITQLQRPLDELQGAIFGGTPAEKKAAEAAAKRERDAERKRQREALDAFASPGGIGPDGKPIKDRHITGPELEGALDDAATIARDILETIFQ